MSTPQPSSGDLKSAQLGLDASVLVNFLANGMLLATVPRYLHSELGASRFWVGIGTTGFFFVAILVRPLIGRLVDQRGRIAFLRWPLVGLTIVALAFGAVDAVWWVVALRFVQGALGATYFTAASALVTDLYPPTRRASAIARLSLNVYVGFVVGPVLAELFSQSSFTAVWVAAAALHLASFGLSFLLHDVRRPQAIRAPGDQAKRFQTAVAVPGIAFASASFAFAAVVAFHAEYAERLGIAHAGWLFATYALAVLVVRTFIGRAADTYGPVRVALPCLALGVGALSVLAVARTPWVAFAGMALTGLGSGSVFPALTADAVDRVPAQDRGSALGSFMVFGDFGQGVAGPLVGLISTVLGFRWVYGVPAIVVAIGFAVLAIDARRGVTSASPTPPRPASATPH